MEEAKAHLEHRHEYDGENFIGRMQGEGSMASRIFGRFRLTRALVKSAFNSMRFRRAAQVALRGLVRATRFKYYDEGGNLLPVSCSSCGWQDSLGHFPESRRVTKIPNDEES